MTPCAVGGCDREGNCELYFPAGLEVLCEAHNDAWRASKAYRRVIFCMTEKSLAAAWADWVAEERNSR